MKITNDHKETDRVTKMIDEFGTKHGCGKDMLNDIDLAVEEVITNVMRYAYDDGKEHEIDVSLEIANDHFIVKIVDDGRRFDPLAASAPDTARK